MAHASFILQPLALWHMLYIYKQCDVNNTEHHMNILAFKFWSSAHHYGHLILVPDGYYTSHYFRSLEYGTVNLLYVPYTLTPLY